MGTRLVRGGTTAGQGAAINLTNIAAVAVSGGTALVAHAAKALLDIGEVQTRTGGIGADGPVSDIAMGTGAGGKVTGVIRTDIAVITLGVGGTAATDRVVRTGIRTSCRRVSRRGTGRT